MTDVPRESPPTTACPRCGTDDVRPAPDSTAVIAWFTCPACGDEWSARLRNWRLDVSVDEAQIRAMFPPAAL